MLTDLTRDIGATFYTPTLHEFQSREGNTNIKLPQKAAGSLVIRPGGLCHSFGPNQTRDKERVGLMGGYFARWMDPTSVD